MLCQKDMFFDGKEYLRSPDSGPAHIRRGFLCEFLRDRSLPGSGIKADLNAESGFRKPRRDFVI